MNKPNPHVLVYPPENALAFETTMLASVTKQETFRFAVWQMTQCLVAPKSLGRHIHFQAAQGLLKEQGWPVFLRSTGGDITPQGEGILNISLAYMTPRAQTSIQQTYTHFCAPLLSFLADFGLNAYCSSVPDAFCDGAFNIVIDGKKLAGTAQRWKQFIDPSGQTYKVIFVHALILIKNDIPASCNAVNKLYQACQNNKRISANAHVNLQDIVTQNLPIPTIKTKLEQYYLHFYQQLGLV